MSAPIPEQLLAPSPGHVVELFKIAPNTISAGAAVFYVTPNTDAAGGSTLAPTVTRDGIDYYGIPIEGEGFQRGGDGAMPQPILTVANVAGLLLPWIEGAEDMIGCEVRRTTVLQSWLDGEPAADPTAFITDDVFIIEQKTRQSPIALEFRLRAAVDRADFKLPGRLCLPTCSYRYRVWDSAAGAWDYSCLLYTSPSPRD